MLMSWGGVVDRYICEFFFICEGDLVSVWEESVNCRKDYIKLRNNYDFRGLLFRR